MRGTVTRPTRPNGGRARVRLPTGHRLLGCPSPGGARREFMRRLVGPVVSLVGAFLIAIGLFAQFYMGSALLKTPLDVDEIIAVDGQAQVPDAQGKIQETPVLAWSVYHVNTSLSDSKVVSFENSQCLVKDIDAPDGCVSSDDPQDRLLSATTDDYATDRRTAEPVNDPKYLPAGSVPHSGVIN